ncbi:MAG: hypothetical protein JWO58_2689 [Chitinophagaceae bacterium]|nr:hypothetical protein [Chitinophagaceae bacterium]
MIAYHFGINDILLTPFYLLIACAVAYILSRQIKNKAFQQYFITGLYLKFAGGILFGIIYAFAYYGGDTQLYWQYSKVIGNALWDSPLDWLKLIFHASPDKDIMKYVAKIGWYNDRSAYFVCQIGGFIAPFCFSTYSAMTLGFAIISFNGLWHLFLVFTNLYPHLHKQIAISLFYLPSLFFWGSGVMKDPLVLAGLGWLMYAFYFGLIKRERIYKCIPLAIISLYILFSVKAYVIACFFPPMIIWLYLLYIKKIRNVILKIMFSTFAISIVLFMITQFFDVLQENTGHDINDLQTITKNIDITNRWIYTSTGKDGSAYNIGASNGTILGTLQLAPQAIFLSLFRPLLWEVKNITMFLSSLENTWFLIMTLYMLYKVGLFNVIKIVANDPTIMFCFVFSLILSFITGVSSGNFGTLVRYKIPMMPFYITSIYAILYKYKSNKAAQQQLRTDKNGRAPVTLYPHKQFAPRPTRTTF